MSDIRRDMPVLARHAGEWDGTYVHVDAAGAIVDRHRAQLTCRFPGDGSWPYYQINRYSWTDGRTEEIHFPATYRDRRIWFDNERINGSAWEVDARSVMLTWTRKDLPGSYLYEMIQLSADGRHRSRVWHWFQDDRLVKRTLIGEIRVG